MNKHERWILLFLELRSIMEKEPNCITRWVRSKLKEKDLEMPGIDPGTSRMLSERSTI